MRTVRDIVAIELIATKHDGLCRATPWQFGYCCCDLSCLAQHCPGNMAECTPGVKVYQEDGEWRIVPPKIVEGEETP